MSFTPEEFERLQRQDLELEKFVLTSWWNVAVRFSWWPGGGVYSWASPTTETVWWLPAGTDITGRTRDEILEAMLVESSDPTLTLRGVPAFQLYEIGDTVIDPLIEANPSLWQWPVWVLTLLEIYRGSVGGPVVHTEVNPMPGAWSGANDAFTVNIIAWVSQQYSARVEDDQGRSWETNQVYSWTYPFYGTTVDIATLTAQALRPLTSSYFSVNMVAETGWEKYKADFEDAYITITWVQFYNTVSSTREWMNGSKLNSLLLRDVTVENHTIQWNVVAYNRYTHNWPDGGALQLRFFTT